MAGQETTRRQRIAAKKIKTRLRTRQAARDKREEQLLLMRANRWRKNQTPAGHIPPQDGTNPPNYFSNTDQTDPVAVKSRLKRRLDYEIWMDNQPRANETITAYSTRMAASTAVSRYTIKDSYVTSLGAYTDKLPRLKALQEMLFHIEVGSLRTIGAAVMAVKDPEILARIDEGITDFLTPTAPRQALPTTSKISDKINELVNLYDPKIRLPRDFDDGGKPAPVPGIFETDDSIPGLTEYRITLPDDQASILNSVLQTKSISDKTSLTEAFYDTLTDNTTVTVTKWVYKAADLTDAPMWLPGAGWLSPAAQARWEEMVTVVKDATEGRQEETQAHDPTMGLVAWVTGVHDCCSGPSSTTKTPATQFEHRIPHEEGGATALDNASRVSQHWHNLKTDGQVKYLHDPVTGMTVWLLPGNIFQVSVPDGPLTPGGARLAMTVSEHRQQAEERARARGEARRAVHNEKIGYDPAAPVPF
ncbi:hypothetical protein [Corynebacterium frankenforstense]|uniref:hypothetical protein n=1 Tax=Corynebacterium frankenforstense TaxID=1230998 RepID=UPI0012EBE1B3|nr:hypothetical protein [Corynebacterium frankenforstense]